MKLRDLDIFDKIALVWGVIVISMTIAAIVMEPKPREIPQWGPRPEIERIGGSGKRTSTPQKWRGFRDPWQEDARKNTARWQEFLEDLDQAGIMLSDPDAVNLWEEDYE